jgi:fructoselysine-6-P-deglycase FrlB-like protein
VLLEKHEPLNHEMACALQSDPVTYVLAGGPNFGAAYCLSMCYLQEMQWMHAVSHNAGEFFHGALEMVTAEQPVIVLLGEDETRPMAERARSFVQRYSQKAFAVDTLGFDLPGVSDEHRGAITPLALASIIWRLARHFAAVRNHSLDLRRYMDKVPY